jgi:hypothetical protein
LSWWQKEEEERNSVGVAGKRSWKSVGVTRKGLVVTRTRTGPRVDGASPLLPPHQAVVVVAVDAVLVGVAAVAAAAVASAAAVGAVPPAFAAGVSQCLAGGTVVGGRLPSSVAGCWWAEQQAHAPTPKVGVVLPQVLCWSRMKEACLVRGALRRSLIMMAMTKGGGREIDE